MALGKDYAAQDCALARALEVLGERWTLLIVRDVFYGVRRYSDFLAHLDIPRAVLAARLQALVEAGVLDKVRYSDTPPRDEYVITEMGRELWPALHTLSAWGGRHLSANGSRRVFAHAACGTLVGPNGICPSCAVEVPVTDLDVLPGVYSPRRDDPVSRAMRLPHRMLTPLTCEH
jgi:DNA-binding HxlR family transcriptional regulator